MAIKEQVAKIVNGITERAVQMLTADPLTPLDTQLWYDKLAGKLAIRANGSTRVLNVQVLSADPLGSVDGQVWVNSATNQLKYQIGGMIFSVGLGTLTAGLQQSLGNYYSVLTSVELQNLSDLGTLYPNYIIDSFNAVATDATYTGASPQGSALRLNGSNLTGKAVYELPTSTVCDEVDGIVVYTPNCWKPTTFVDNGDGTSTIVVAGDATGYFADLKSVLIYYEATVNGLIRSVYAHGGNNKLAIFNVIGTPVHAGGTPGTTTININNSPALNGGGHVDVLAQLGVAATALRVYPLDLTLKVGGAGALGSQDTVHPVDAHGLDQLRTLGGDIFRIISTDLKENVQKIAIQYSPNRQYWIIGCMHVLPAPTADYLELVIYYSNDGLNTLNRMVPTYPLNEAFSNDQFNSSPNYYFWDDHCMIISDSGKFVLVHEVGTTNSTYQKPKIAYGDLTQSAPVLTYTAAVTPDGPGIAPFSTYSHHWSLDCMALDPNDNYLIVVCTDQQNGIKNDVWFKNGGATFMGCSDSYFYCQVSNDSRVAWYMNLEGEQQAFHVGVADNNDYPFWLKKKISEIETQYAATPRANHSGFRMNSAFMNEAGTSEPISTEGSCFHIATSFDADKVRSWWWSDSNERSFYTEVHLEDVFVGTDEQQLITFDHVPTTGQWSLTFGANTTAALANSITAAQLQTALQGLASIGAGNVLVTGNFSIGFTIHFTGALQKMPQSLLILASNSLQDGVPEAVTPTIAETVPGVLPIYPHFNNQYRHLNAGVGDLVMLMGNRMDADYAYWSGMNAGNDTGYGGFKTRRLKKHPTNTNRAFMAWQRYQNLDAVSSGAYLTDGFFLQMYHLDTFQGMFDNHDGGQAAASYIGTSAGANYGTELAQRVVPDRSITLRTFSPQILFTWNNYPMNLPRNGVGQFVRCKLVNETGGLPNEASAIATSPTKISIFDYYTGAVTWVPFRFDNVPLTSGTALWAVLYLENVNVTTDWPTGASEPGGGAEVGWYGAGSGTTSAVKQAGVWAQTNAYALNYRLFDYFIEPFKTPEIAAHPRYDLCIPSGVYMSVQESQLEWVDSAKTQLALTYRIGGNITEDTATHNNNATVLQRLFNVPAADTFASDLNAPNPTVVLGYDNATFDHNLMFHVRLSDPTAIPQDKYGNPRFASSDHNFPLRGIDYAGGYALNWTATNMWATNNLNYGHTPDTRFKSGWAMHGAQAGVIEYYAGNSANSRSELFIWEMEIAPTATDLVGTKIMVSYGAGNGYYIAINAGAPLFQWQNINGPAMISGYATQSSTVLTAGEYCRLRFTREIDQFIHIYRWRNSIEGWLELPYTTQTYMAGKSVYTYQNVPIYVMAHYNNANNIDGLMGEVKLAIGANSFLNGDALVDQRPIVQHHNVGDRVLAKRQWTPAPSAVNGDGSADANGVSMNNVVMIAPLGQTGKVAGRDQLLKFTDLSMPQGNKLAATVQIDRVSTNAQSAIQGFLLNYQKQ